MKPLSNVAETVAVCAAFIDSNYMVCASQSTFDSYILVFIAFLFKNATEIVKTLEKVTFV